MKTLKRFSTKIIDDVFTDEISFFKPKFEVDYDAYVERLWDSNPELHKILKMQRTWRPQGMACFLIWK